MRLLPLVLTTADQNRLQEILKELLRKTASRCVLLVDLSGRCLAHVASTGKFDVDALAALLAGTFSSLRAIAELVGETQFTVMFHEGERNRIHNVFVDEERFLTVISGQRTTLGRVRLHAENAVEQIAARFREISQRGMEAAAPLHASLAKDTGERLDEVFDS
jgi:predicted regulator of Ras-like GTPase activity (Roadblock/LC7/MglB family)